MARWLEAAPADTSAEVNPASGSEPEESGDGDLASVSDELTDALQAATFYVDAVRKIAADRPPIADKRDRDVLALATDQITRANRAVKRLHAALTARSLD